MRRCMCSALAFRESNSLQVAIWALCMLLEGIVTLLHAFIDIKVHLGGHIFHVFSLSQDLLIIFGELLNFEHPIFHLFTSFSSIWWPPFSQFLTKFMVLFSLKCWRGVSFSSLICISIIYLSYLLSCLFGIHIYHTFFFVATILVVCGDWNTEMGF